MDPNETLSILREAVERYERLRESGARDAVTVATLVHLADTIAEMFDALDGWITNGGFLPNSWQ